MSDSGVIVSLDDKSVLRSKVVLDYTSRDFTAIRAQLIGIAKGLMPEWQTIGENGDLGTVLIELFAYMGDVTNFYIDRTASEAFLATALRPQSVLYIADMLGYTPIGQQAASVQLSFGLDANALLPVTVPQGTRIYSGSADATNLVVFTLDAPVTLNPGNTKVIGFASEGIIIDSEILGVSQGLPFTEYIIVNTGVVYGSVSVVSGEGPDSVQWQYFSDLSLARPTQPAFTTFADDTGQTHVLFGDNGSGRIPPVGARIYVSYRFGVGAVANGLLPGVLDTVQPNGINDFWGITVTNTSSPVGGTDPESVESMRSSIPRSAARLKQRAVTLNDFADLALQIPGVAKSVAYGTVYTAVHVKIAPQGGQATPDYMATLVQEVEAYMADKTLVGSIVFAEPNDVDDPILGLWTNVFIRVRLHVQSGYNRSSVRTQVDSVIRQILSFNNVDFDTRVSVGTMYRAALAVTGVEYAEIQWLTASGAPSTVVDQGMGGLLQGTVATFSALPTGLVASDGGKAWSTLDNGHIWIWPSSGSTWIDGGPLTGWTVAEIPPDQLRIPRISPTSVTELSSNFPYLSTDELTHDGLWVRAVGGIPGS